MTEGMGSRPISSRQVYPQDSEPADNRPGVLWVDTSQNPPATKVYDPDTATWEPVATSNVKVQDGEPSETKEGLIWVDTSTNPVEAKVYNADTASWVGIATPEIDDHTAVSDAHHSRYTNGEAQTATHSLQAQGAFNYDGDGDHIIWTMKPNAGNSEADYILYDLSTGTEIGTMWSQAAGGSGYGYPFSHANITTDINDDPEFKVITDEV